MIGKGKKTGKILISLLLVISMVTAMTMTSLAAQQARAASVVRFRTAVINQITLGENGSAEVQRGGDLLPVYEGMRLNKGDIVRTKGIAVLYILIDQDKIIRLDNDTEAELTETLLGVKVKMKLVKGSMFFNVVEKLSDDESLQFVYGNITISIRGTSAEMIGEGGVFGMILPDGNVTLEMAGGPDGAVQTLEIGPGTRFDCSDGNAALGTAPVFKTSSVTLSELPVSLLTEMKNDRQLAERIVRSTPESVGPGGAVYASVGSINLDAALDRYIAVNEKIGNLKIELPEEIRRLAAANQGKTLTVTGTGSGSSDASGSSGSGNSGSGNSGSGSSGSGSSGSGSSGSGSSSPEPQKVTCPGCGQKVTEEVLKVFHVRLACGHYACQSGNHEKLPCGHYACQSGNHEKLPCGQHYKCQTAESEWVNHEKKDCGHYACQEGTHELLPCGEHYKCQVAESEWTNHEMKDCGHYACQEGVHELLPCGEHYKCQVAESEWANHEKKDCGHYVCDGSDHTRLACGHYVCGITEEERALHSEIREGSGDYYCQHAGEYKLCPGCGKPVSIDREGNVTEEGHMLLACGHHACEEGEHTLLECEEHYRCKVSPDEWENHRKGDCGHCVCTIEEDQTAHRLLSCGNVYACKTPEEQIWLHDSQLLCGMYFCEALTDGWRYHIPVMKKVGGVYSQIVCLCTCGMSDVVKCPVCGAVGIRASDFLGSHCVYDSEGHCIKCEGTIQNIEPALGALQTIYDLTDEQIDYLLQYVGITVLAPLVSTEGAVLKQAYIPEAVPEEIKEGEAEEEEKEADVLTQASDPEEEPKEETAAEEESAAAVPDEDPGVDPAEDPTEEPENDQIPEVNAVLPEENTETIGEASGTEKEAVEGSSSAEQENKEEEFPPAVD